MQMPPFSGLVKYPSDGKNSLLLMQTKHQKKKKKLMKR